MTILYEIATKISMINAVGPVLRAIIAETKGLEGSINNLTKSFDKMGTAGKLALGGVFGIASGAVIFGALGKLAESGKELLNQQEQLQRMGLSLADVNRMTADGYARIAKEVPTAQVSEYLKVIRELRGAVGSTGAAEKLAPQALQVQALLANTTGGDQSEAFWQLLRAAEMKGIVTNEKKLQSFIDATVPWVLGTGGKVTPGGFQAFARRGGAAWINADLEKALPGMAVAIADLGGMTAGQSMMSLSQVMTGSHVLSRQTFDIMSKLGLIDKSKVSPAGRGGGGVQIHTGAIAGSLSHVGDLPGWVNDVLMPAIDKAAGGRSGAARAAGSDEAFSQSVLAKIFPNRNALRMALMWGMPEFREQIAKDAGIVSQVLPRDQAYQEFIHKNPVGVQLAFKEQWESMLSAIGSPLMVAAMPVMEKMTEFFTWFGEWANSNQDRITLIGKVFAGLAIGLTALGAVAIISGLTALAGTGGLLFGLAAGLTALAALNFNWVKDWIIKPMDQFRHSITDAFQRMFDSVGEWLKSWLPSWALKKDMSFGGGSAPLGRFSEGRVWPVYYGGMPFGGSYGGGGGTIHASLGGSASRGLGGGFGGGGLAGGGAYNVSKAYDLIKAAGGTDEEARTLAAISQAESSGNTLAHNTKGRDNSYGLWQINMLGGMGLERLAKYGLKGNEDLFDPATNARVALAIHRAAGGYRDWSTFGSGAYRKFLSSGATGSTSGSASSGGHIGGMLTIGDAAYHFGSGSGSLAHIPYGDYPITPGAIGPWGAAHGALGLNNNAIWDADLNRMRTGIELHPGHNALFTAGCVAIAKGEYPAFKAKVMDMIHTTGKAFLHVGKGGASVTPYRGFGSSSVARGGQQASLTHVHHHYLDGKQIASNTVSHVLRSSEHSRGAAYFDGYHTFAGADRQTATA